MLSLVALQGFVAVAEEGSFRGAALRLNTSQPPLSRQVQKLERSLGVELFVRTGRGADLTPAGRALLPEARAILDRVQGVGAVAKSAQRGDSGALTLAFTAVVALTMLSEILRTVQVHLPGVEFSLLELVTAQQLEGILSGTIDIGLARGVQETDTLATRSVHAESMVLALDEHHPLARAGQPVTIAEVAREPVVSYSPTMARYLHDLVANAFISRDITPRFVQTVTQVTSAMAIAASGLAVALVPASARALRLPSVRLLPIADVEPGTFRTMAVWRRDNDNPALQRLLRLL